MPISKLALAALPFAAMLAPAAHAQTVVADPDRVAEVIRDAGYKALRVEPTDTKSGVHLESAVNGYSYSIFFNDCDDAHRNCKTVQFYIGFAPKTKPPIDKLNGFAQEHRWGRFYLDGEGDPCLEMDLDLDKGGMSKELFIDNVEFWASILGAYADFVFSFDKPADAPADKKPAAN